MPGECQTRFSVCKKISKRTMVIYWSCFRKKSGTVSVKTVHKEFGTIWLKGCCWNSQNQFSRATSPLSRGRLRSKGHGKLSIHYAADVETIETIFRIIVSANQLSLYGAIAEICEEYETLHARTVRPVMMVQSSSSIALKCVQDRSTFGL